VRGEHGEGERERDGGPRGVRRSTTAAEASTIFDVAVQAAVLYYASGESVKTMTATADTGMRENPVKRLETLPGVTDP
jgi:hypothetical protein